MTGRERVQAALAHRQPDRVPIELRFAPELATKLARAVGVREDELPA